MLRVGSALVLAPLALVAAYFGGLPFAVFWALAGIAVLWEWIAMVAGHNYRMMFSACGTAIAVAGLVAWRGRPIAAMLLVGLGALAAAIFAPGARRGWIMGGIFYAGVMLMAPVLLRADDAYGFLAILLLFAIVWTTDILGYFAGRAIGGPNLMPAVSPNKTWSGAVAGAVGAMIVAVAVARVYGWRRYLRRSPASRCCCRAWRRPAICSSPGSSAASAPRTQANSSRGTAASWTGSTDFGRRR